MQTGKMSTAGTYVLVFSMLVLGAVSVQATEEFADPLGGASERQLSELAAAKKEAPLKRVAGDDELIARLPEDTTPTFEIRRVQLSGNTLLSDAELLGALPVVYYAGTKNAGEPSDHLYDFRALGQVVAEPGTARTVSARTIRGLTQYILSIYTKRGYAGIYVYVPSEAFGENKELKQGILPITIVEAKVSDVGVTSYNIQGEPVEKGWLKRSVLLDWSPIKEGQVARRKELDELVNLLNLNPDRYVSAVVSKGDEPDSLAVEYNVYEANPWHFFAQVDNAGTKDRQWTPRFGVINTNTLGFDDTLTLIYQTPLDKRAGDEFSAYGSYDFPVMGPRLRLNLFGGYNEFDIDGTGDIDFLGRGHFYGGTLRLNVLQHKGWFFDVTGTLSHLTSKLTPSLFPKELGSDVDIDQWGVGVELYRRDDMTDTRFALQRFASFDGSGDRELGLARAGAKSNFSIYTAAANHSRYLDADKIQNLSGSFRFITADERLHPSQMTAFGGMYSVRGYDEYEIIGDGGILASIQYEYDLVRHAQARRAQGAELTENNRKPFVRKFAPLAFMDYGQARIQDAGPHEHTDQELCSVGIGAKLELGDNFTGVIYYGYPLIATADTREGKGRINVGFLWRF
ncbi:MAG: ShlB/FhaC/HecB family hemolysin secretion/activation protein [Phycisphaerae bacterium]|nr:ShlB/FhaC/HecB family hemolysin secretion/activation protein [Phycisphaerae bacterium]